MRNFELVYRRIVTRWRVYHGVRSPGELPLIARGSGELVREVLDPAAWKEIQAQVTGIKGVEE